VRIAWIGPQPLAGGGVPQLAGVMLLALAERGVTIDAFMATGELQTMALDHPGIRAIALPIAWDGAAQDGRSPAARFLSGQRARAQAQRRLATTLAEHHATRSYDVVYQFSQFELVGLRRHRPVLPPIVVHPETHAAGELRWLVRERDLAWQGGSRAAWGAAATMLATRAVVQRRDARAVDALIAPSRIFAEHLRRDYGLRPEALHVVPNCIDLTQFSASGTAGGRAGPVRILFVSRMAVRKGVDLVVALSHRLADLEGKVELEAIGNHALWSDYRPLLGDLHSGIGRYRPHVPPAELARLLREADLLVQPSRFEPFALTVAEALASGMPVVASDEVGACEDVEAGCCSTFPDGDLDAFEAAVRHAVARARGDRADAVASLARSEAERLFSPGGVAERLHGVLERAALPRRPE
jgi:glycosyltransferase involved in cell wall biosynthesis